MVFNTQNLPASKRNNRAGLYSSEVLMVRKSSPLQPVPDPPRSGADLGELRRNLGLAQPAELHAVQTPSADTSVAAGAHARLSEARSALHAEQAHVLDVEHQVASLESQLEPLGTDRVRCEQTLAEAREPLIRWQADPMSGPVPALSPEARRLIRDTGDDLEGITERQRVVGEAIGQKKVELQQARNGVENAATTLHQAAIAVLGERLESYVNEAIRLAHEGAVARDRALATLSYLEAAGYSKTVVSTRLYLHPVTKMPLPPGQFSEPKISVERERLKAASSIESDQRVFEEHKASLVAQFEKLLSDEEES
jgi:hypothetical protein